MRFRKGDLVEWQSGAGKETSIIEEAGIHKERKQPFVKVHATEFFKADILRTKMKRR